MVSQNHGTDAKKPPGSFQARLPVLPLLNRLSLESVDENFSYLLPGQVWQAMPSHDERWVLEWRDAEQKINGFTVIHPMAEQGDGFVADVSGEETDWWMSLAGVGIQSFFVHSYRNPDIPEPTDLIGYDLGTGATKWVLPSKQFTGFFEGQLVIATKTAGEITFLTCNESTGEITGKHIGTLKQPENRWKEAEQYRKKDEHYGLLENFLRKTLGLAPEGTIEYLDYADRMIFSFYLYKNNRLVQYVAIVNRLRKIEYLEIIEENLEKEGKSTFLEKNGWLFFIRNKKRFVGINLAV